MEYEPSGSLGVTAELRGPVEGPLAVDEPAEPFVTHFMVETPDGPRPADFRASAWSTLCGRPCTIRYRFDLGRATEALSNVEVAWAAGDVAFAPPSTWLLRPAHAADNSKYRFRASTTSSTQFVTGLRKVADPRGDAYGGDASDLGQSPFTAFGPLRVLPLSAPGVTAALTPGLLPPESALKAWLEAELAAITDYFGRAPDDHLILFVAPGTSDVTRGETLGGGGAAILVRLGTKATSADALRDDWVLAHELTHVAMPSIGYEYRWFSEGLACYVEPLARVRAGLLDEKKMWAELVEGLPQGLPQKQDQGLDGSSEWGRVYWGGTLFFLLADLEIRERSSGGKSLKDALRHVAATGANVEQWWTLDRVISVADDGTGLDVLRRFYERFGRARGTVDLADLWQRLGVRVEGKSVTFDDSAPLAGIRRALTSPEARPKNTEKSAAP